VERSNGKAQPLTGIRRRMLEIPRARVFRNAIVWRDIRRESLYVSARAREAGFQPLDFQRLGNSLANRETKRFFILGSGSSVNKLTNQNFEEVRSHTSVGINAWLLHDFVPDIYAYEPVTHRQTDHFGTLRLLAAKDFGLAEPQILFLKPRAPIEQEQLEHIPRTLHKNTYLYGRATPFTRSPLNLGRDINWAITTQRMSRTRNVTLDSGASVFRMTYLALLMRFTEIVYVGVDLHDSRYFWEENRDFLEANGLASFDSGQTPGPHETTNAENRPFVITEILRALVTAMSPRREFRLFTANPESPLAEFMPVYTWGD
jgi:hypothetical protein